TINPAAEMCWELFVEMIVPRDRPGIEDGEIVGLLAVFEAAHERALFFLLLAQPDGRKVDPIINHVLKARLVEGLLDRVVLLPKPLAGRAFDGAPGDVIFVGNQAQTLEL